MEHTHAIRRGGAIAADQEGCAIHVVIVRAKESSHLPATLTGRPLAQSSLSAFRLLVVYSPDPSVVGVPRIVGAQPLVVGRAGPGLTLDDGRVSRSHAAFEMRDGVPYVRDLGSRNGTFVNAEPIRDRALSDQDVIRVGDHCLLLQELNGDDVRRTLETPARSDRLIGDGRAMRELREEIGRARSGRVAVLLIGETGTGKEVAAAEIHGQWARAGAFVPVNCAAIPENLAEAELFGHVRGAFTGANHESHGLFGAADGGTIFLDEIGEMPLSLQPKLLRALAVGEIRRVGESQSRRVDVRVVAATNVDLEAAVSRHTFRADLLARLAGHIIRTPPLRERREDLLVLASHFLASALNVRRESVPQWFSPDAAEALLVHPWTFNVRELEQTLRAAAPRVERTTLELHHLPLATALPISTRVDNDNTARSAPPTLERILQVRPDATPNAEELRVVIEHFGGNVSRIAAFFGKERRQIYRWAARHGIDLDEVR